MKIKIFYISIISLVSFCLISCSAGKESGINDLVKKDTVATIGDDVISLKEYEDFYIKNNGGISAIQKATDESKSQFLDLLVKYRLKVRDAFYKNYDKDPGVIAEIKEYEKSLSIPYIIEKEITEPNLKLWYERRKQNIKVSAILIRTDWNNPEDTLKKHNFVMSIYDSLRAGKSFKDLAFKYSELPTAKTDSGSIGYITAGQTVPFFEEAVYSLKKGEYPKNPIKLKPGYIIPRIDDIEERTGGKKFSHILFQYKKNTAEDSLQTEAAADSILQLLKSGASFEELVVKHSDDLDSKNRAGELGSFERDPNLEPKDFWKALFELKKGELSKPLKTWFGIHLVKFVGIDPYPAFLEIKEKLKEEYQALKYNSDYQIFLSNLKNKIKFQTNIETMNAFYRQIDTSSAVSSGSWAASITEDVNNRTLFTYADRAVKIDTIVKIINNTAEFRDIKFTPDQYNKTIERLGEILIMQYKADMVPIEHPEFKKVMKEYIDGILLYKAEQEAVWNKLSITDSGLKEFYEKNKDQYKWSERAVLSEIYVKNDTLINTIYSMLTDTLPKPVKGKKGKKNVKTVVVPTFDELAEKYTEREGYKERKGRWEPLSETDNPLALRAFEMQPGEISKPFRFENGHVIIKLIKIDPPRIKTFEECGAELSSKYQEAETKRLEGLWIDSLKQIFPVKRFDEKLKDAFSTDK